MKRSKNQNREVLLTGEGVNQHTLYGEFSRNDDSIVVDNECQLRHETPSGKFAEHNTLLVQQGTWVLGRQVEYNPLDRKVQRVWD
jgi:hypothetical protein